MFSYYMFAVVFQRPVTVVFQRAGFGPVWCFSGD